MPTAGRSVALVTGGSRGIGREVVRRLARDGYAVAFCYQSRSEEAESCVHQVEASNGSAFSTRVDVSDFEQVSAWVSDTERRIGPISVVVTCAGIVRDNVAINMPESDWHAVLETNLSGTFNVCRAVMFGLLKRRTGSIINLSSVSGIYGNVGQANYSAAKAGIIGLAKSLAKEAGPHGVRVNVVAPGFIETEMTSTIADSVRRDLISRIPMRRWGVAEDVADLVSFLASPEASYITAGVFPVDGGMTL